MSRIGERLRKRYAERREDRLASRVATKDDLTQLRRDMNRNMKQTDPSRVSGRQAAGKAVRIAKRGLDNVARSLNTPYDNRRPQISQLPRKKSDIGIGQGMNLERLKMPGLRGQNIAGRKKK